MTGITRLGFSTVQRAFIGPLSRQKLEKFLPPLSTMQSSQSSNPLVRRWENQTTAKTTLVKNDFRLPLVDLKAHFSTKKQKEFVILKDGSKVSKEALEITMKVLEGIAQQSFAALYSFVEENQPYNLSKNVGLSDPEMRKVVVNAVKMQGCTLKLVDPTGKNKEARSAIEIFIKKEKQG